MTYAVTASLRNYWLDAFLRASNPPSGARLGGAFYLGTAAMATLIKTKTSGGTYGTPVNGVITLTNVPLALTHNANGTIVECTLLDSSTGAVITGLVAGLTGGKEVVVDDEVISAGEASNITDFRAQLASLSANGNVSLNIAFRNRFLRMLFSLDTVHFSAAGTIKLYDGTVPSVDVAATGTELWTIATTTTTWNAAASASSALAATLTANAVASGTATYGRFAWTHSATDYVIQFKVAEITGTTTGAMTISSSYTITACSMAI